MNQSLGITSQQHAQLVALPTATLSSVLSKMGVTNVWVRKALPLSGQARQRVAGTAFTLRFAPARAGLSLPVNTRTAIEQMPQGCIAVADTGNVVDVGVMGDVLSLRMQYRGVQALVTDGAVRDADSIKACGLPVWSTAVAAPLPTDGLVLVGVQEIVRCGGVTLCPEDILVCDTDGAVVIPRNLMCSVIDLAEEMERFEGWVITQVKAGASLPGLYPPDENTTQRYQSWLNEKF
ncbi:ribonuclease activity regulator RraA [Pseudomonas sp. Q11]|uniref:RraA family protein n=1 Tax=Pseudomonas sp. Q11 TaxID=2968470 RepID=UPI0021092518|nr:ribonuclease activity regulator RraA [Pseudomonas sp. Q11]MCQ6258282.1 ribonuclease activity regulator RraA [Pseudomonas sp. Q11]